jgi:L-threonylcarbamoyladenylate synthase
MPSATNITRAAEYLLAGQLIGLPTETVYGLAARGDDEAAVDRIFIAKKRPRNNPLILHVADPADAMSLFDVESSPELRRRAERLQAFWPGPLTLVGSRHASILDEVTAGNATVAVRVPNHPVALALLRRLAEIAGRVIPLAAPSANVSNYVSPTTASHVIEGLGPAVALILDGGPCNVGVESTIVWLPDDSSPVRILRAGGISPEQLAITLGEEVELAISTAKSSDIVTAPGQFAKHYSPRTPLYLLENASERSPFAANSRVLRIVFGQVGPESSVDVWSFNIDGRLETAATELYATLRRADQAGYDAIEIVGCANTGIGMAIMDRLRRAAIT